MWGSCRPLHRAASAGSFFRCRPETAAHAARLCAAVKACSAGLSRRATGRGLWGTWAATERCRSKRGLRMADLFKEKREKAGTKAMSQLEIDAHLMREKTARLRELRLAQEAANGAARPAPARSAGPAAKKKKSGKSGEKGPSLSDWLDTQQNQGRRG
jgi:hypothetical protein